MSILYIPFIVFATFALLAVFVYLGARTVRERRERESAGDRKGRLGETLVSEVLDRCRIAGDVLLDNVVLTNPATGVSNEIDHILLSTRGIFVVETKTRAGEIRGDDCDEEWEQTLGKGDIRHTFRSPVLQNEAHVSKVKAVTKCRAVENVVVFAQGNISNVRSDFVHTLDDLPGFLASRPQGALDAAERDEAVKRLKAAMAQSVTAEEHRKNMRERYGE